MHLHFLVEFYESLKTAINYYIGRPIFYHQVLRSIFVCMFEINIIQEYVFKIKACEMHDCFQTV